MNLESGPRFADICKQGIKVKEGAKDSCKVKKLLPFLMSGITFHLNKI